MLRIYQRLWQVNWAEQWQYRANLLMYLLYWLVSPIVYLSVWVTIANSQGSVKGLTANDFITYYMTLLIVDQLTSDITVHIFAYKIQDGTLSGELLRPIHPILTNNLINNLAFKALTFIVLIPVWILLFLLFQPNFSGVTFLSMALAIPAVILGFAINFLFSSAITCLAFWTTRVYSLMEFYGALRILFSGQFVPLVLMPPLIQVIAKFLPFQLYLYFPIRLILGEITPQEALVNFGWGLVWLVVGLGCFWLVWREGVKRFSAVGA
jgi:viologen exporter family transport system permease protein